MRLGVFALLTLVGVSGACKPRMMRSDVQSESESGDGRWGVWFKCQSDTTMLKQRMADLIVRKLGWTLSESFGQTQVTTAESNDGRSVGFFLSDPSTDALYIRDRRPDLGIVDAKLTYTRRTTNPNAPGQLVKDPAPTTIPFVSSKEIIAGLFTKGRLTEFDAPDCSFEQFIDHVAMRLNVVAWSQKSFISFPEPNSTVYNKEMWKEFEWRKFVLKEGISVDDAFDDIWNENGKVAYTFECQNACRGIQLQGMRDYFKRIKGTDVFTNLIETLSPRMPIASAVTGKVLSSVYNVAPLNVIAGDWVYFYNDDPVTHDLYDGDQGSNAFAIGRGLFGRYYYNQPPRTLPEYLCFVRSWRYDDREEAIRRYKENPKAFPDFKLSLDNLPTYDPKDNCDPKTLPREKLEAMMMPPEDDPGGVKGGMFLANRHFPALNLSSETRSQSCPNKNKGTCSIDGTPMAPNCDPAKEFCDFVFDRDPL